MSRDFLYAFRLLVVSLVVGIAFNFSPLKKLESTVLAVPARFFSLQAFHFRSLGINFWSNVVNLPELGAKVANLTEKNLALQSEIASLKQENYRLEVLGRELNFTQSLASDISLVEANVIGQEYFPNGSNTLSLNKGSLDEVAVGDIVTFANYFLGKVIRVLPHSSVVMFLQDANFKASCFDQDSPSGLEGTCFTKGGSLMFGNLDPGAPINIGDLVLTSGKDGSYPLGRIVGKVAQINGNLYDISRTAVLELLVKPTPNIVFVETDYEKY